MNVDPNVITTVVIHNKDSETGEDIPGAEFVISKEDDDGNKVYYHDNNGTPECIDIGDKTPEQAVEDGTITGVTTDEDGNAEFPHVGEGEYTAHQTDPAPGYSEDTPNVNFTVDNTTGDTLPVEVSGNPSFTSTVSIHNKNSDSGESIQGSDFVIYKEDDDNTKLYYRENAGIPEWVDIGNTTPEQAAEEGLITVVTTNSDGIAEFPNVEKGEYYVHQTDPAPGYNHIVNDIQISIDTTSGDKLPVEVSSIPGSVLPETGGPGTTLFYVLGFLFMASAYCITVLKRKQ